MGLRVSKLSSIMIGVPKRGVNYKRIGGPLTPRGYIPICVGVNGQTKRFMIHTKALGDSDFLEFLYRSAEEYGFRNDGVLRIPYEAKDFEEWLMFRKSKLKKLVRVKQTLSY